MSIVLDNSVAIDWLVDSQQGPQAHRLIRKHVGALIVPSLFWIELIYVLGKHVKRDSISLGHRDFCIRQVRLLDAEVDVDAASPGRPFDRVLTLCDQHGLTIYEAVYLELALRRETGIITFDNALAAAARAAGVEVLSTP